MQIPFNKENLPILEALASETRMNIIELLASNDMNIKQLSEALGITSSIVARHVRQLEEAKVIKTKHIPGKSGLQKVSTLAIENINIIFPKKVFPDYLVKEVSLPVGMYTDFEAHPTCGLATAHSVIGLDEPKVFMDSRRMDASIIWLSKGFVEYRIPNPLTENQQLALLELSMELSSEFPYSNNNWPSDISFAINGKDIGTWTCPGNFSDTRGKFTPMWWSDNSSQYGLLKTLRITPYNVAIDGDIISDESIYTLHFEEEIIKLRIEIKEDATHVGGFTIFGKGFGNWDQNIEWKFYYTEKK
nr:ArsR family transcriptional regulator [Paenibacillus bovis]